MKAKRVYKYSSTLSWTSAPNWSGSSRPYLGRFTPRKETRHSFYRRPGGPQGRSPTFYAPCHFVFFLKQQWIRYERWVCLILSVIRTCENDCFQCLRVLRIWWKSVRDLGHVLRFYASKWRLPKFLTWFAILWVEFPFFDRDIFKINCV